MRLVALQLDDWRNVAHTVVELHPRFNVFSGDNAQGKTNLLEAVFFLATLRSFRAGKNEELVRFGANEARVRARLERGGLRHLLEAQVRPRQRTLRIDEKAIRSSGDWFGRLSVVLFAPDDLAIPKGSPSLRRRFLDRAVFGAQPSYLKLAQDYEKVVRSRNAVLRETPLAPSSGIAALLETYDEQLTIFGAQIVERRLAYLAIATERIAKAFASITRSGAEASVRYETRTPDAAAIRQALLASRPQDRARGFTTCGPHTDDVRWLIDGREAAHYGSQGQLRALMLAAKVAEIEQVEESLGEPALLMLDDVSSELDPQRNEYLFEFLRDKSCQCLITTTDRSHILLTENRKDFQVVMGGFAPRE